MSQRKLFKRPRAEKPSNVKVAAGHDENNLRTAREILEDPEHWGGQEAGMVRWARAVVERLGSNESAGAIR